MVQLRTDGQVLPPTFFGNFATATNTILANDTLFASRRRASPSDFNTQISSISVSGNTTSVTAYTILGGRTPLSGSNVAAAIDRAPEGQKTALYGFPVEAVSAANVGDGYNAGGGGGSSTTSVGLIVAVAVLGTFLLLAVVILAVYAMRRSPVYRVSAQGPSTGKDTPRVSFDDTFVLPPSRKDSQMVWPAGRIRPSAAHIDLDEPPAEDTTGIYRSLPTSPYSPARTPSLLVKPAASSPASKYSAELPVMTVPSVARSWERPLADSNVAKGKDVPSRKTSTVHLDRDENDNNDINNILNNNNNRDSDTDDLATVERLPLPAVVQAEAPATMAWTEVSGPSVSSASTTRAKTGRESAAASTPTTTTVRRPSTISVREQAAAVAAASLPTLQSQGTQPLLLNDQAEPQSASALASPRSAAAGADHDSTSRRRRSSVNNSSVAPAPQATSTPMTMARRGEDRPLALSSPMATAAASSSRQAAAGPNVNLNSASKGSMPLAPANNMAWTNNTSTPAARGSAGPDDEFLAAIAALRQVKQDLAKDEDQLMRERARASLQEELNRIRHAQSPERIDSILVDEYTHIEPLPAAEVFIRRKLLRHHSGAALAPPPISQADAKQRSVSAHAITPLSAMGSPASAAADSPNETTRAVLRDTLRRWSSGRVQSFTVQSAASPGRGSVQGPADGSFSRSRMSWSESGPLSPVRRASVLSMNAEQAASPRRVRVMSASGQTGVAEHVQTPDGRPSWQHVWHGDDESQDVFPGTVTMPGQPVSHGAVNSFRSVVPQRPSQAWSTTSAEEHITPMPRRSATSVASRTSTDIVRAHPAMTRLEEEMAEFRNRQHELQRARGLRSDGSLA